MLFRSVQQAVGGYWRQLTSSIAGLSVAVALGVVLTPLYGLTGMAASVGSGIVTAAVVPLFQLMVHERLSPFHAPFGSLLVRALGISLAAGALGLLVARIPHPAELVVFVPLLLGSVWCSCRYALPHDDRLSLGKKTAKKLRLI